MLILAAALTLGACGDNGDDGGGEGAGEDAGETAEPTPGDTTGDSPTPSPDDSHADDQDMAACTNDQAGYTIEYPSTWHTNSGEVTAPCTLFDPEPIEVEEGTEASTVITLNASDTDFRDASADDAFGDVRSRDSAVIDDREAVAVVAEATGQALLDEGTLSYTWVVNMQDGSLVASTHDMAGRDFRADSDVLDEMISSLDFSAAAPNGAANGDGGDANGEDGDARRTVVAQYEGGGRPFTVIAVERADELCLVARAGGSEGEQTCWNAGAADEGMTLRSLDVPGGADALGGLAAPHVTRVLAGTENEGTVGFRTSGIEGTDTRAWAMPLASSETDRVIGYNDDHEMEVALDAAGEPTSVLPNVNTRPESIEPSEEVRLLDEVETGLHAGYDRVAFRFGDGVPGYEAGYEDRPISEAGSGAEIDIRGDGVIVMRMEQASGRERTGDAERTYTGPGRLPGAGTFTMTEVVQTGDFEGVLTWAVGADSEQPFRVQVFDEVLVVDIRHPEA